MASWGQNGPMELTIPDVKRRSVANLKNIFFVNSIIYKGAVAPGSEVTFFCQPSPILLSPTIQAKKFSISVIALFDNKKVKFKLI